MAINHPTVRHWTFPPAAHEYTTRDTMLYALGLGIGVDPIDPGQLRFVIENELQAVPTMACVMGSPGLWLSDPRTGVDWVRVVHGEQDLRLVAPVPIAGRVVAHNRVVGIADKGSGRGALLQVRRDLTVDGADMPFAQLCQTLFLRDEGGFDAEGTLSDAVPVLPPIAEEAEVAGEIALPTLPQAALIYRLSGDYAPLHSDPAVAHAAGFPRPILHGLCTFGIAAHAALRLFGGNDAARLTRIAARFSAPVFPGETIRFTFYRDDPGVFRLRAMVVEREVMVLDKGVVEIAETMA